LNTFYAQWRVRSGLITLLRDENDSPPENLLQSVWQQQRLLREQLKTLDGQTVRVLHPGFRSLEGGPDFRGAILQIGSGSPITGDVEVDLRSSGWRAHGHHKNPAFKQVIMQAVWESERPATDGPPLLVLRNALDAPLGELSMWLGNDSPRSLPAQFRGQCCGPLTTLSAEDLEALLRQAAQVRLQSKAAAIQARARQAGWEQALWEGLFKALGYKHNIWPMQRLAELRLRWAVQGAEAIGIQSRLLGISGLLPAELTRSQNGADRYLRKVWDQWWRERDEFIDCILPKAAWRFHGLRPANHPQRRLALASRWAVEGSLTAKLERWCSREIPASALPDSLLEVFQVEPDEFWSWHCTFRSTRMKKSQPLLGATRATDLAANVVLPWLWIRAFEGKNTPLQKSIEQRYYAWPPAEDNSLLRLARERLLGGASRRLLSGAAVQQGLIQLVRDFCEHSNALCENCMLPKMVREWGNGAR
jgi:hypothetical protein